MDYSAMDYMVWQFYGVVPYLLLVLPFAFTAWLLAPRIGHTQWRWLWIVAALIPIVNIAAAFVFAIVLVGHVLDCLNVMARSGDGPSGPNR